MSWLETLRDHANQHGQRATGALLGFSASTVNQVLKGTYMADTKQIEARVRERISDTWLGALRAECERTNQGMAAARIGVSDSRCDFSPIEFESTEDSRAGDELADYLET
jgi:hypothetical protein